MIAVRQTMHGPLWTVERDRIEVQLWGPNAERDYWAVDWTDFDSRDEQEGYERVGGYARAATLGEIPLVVPSEFAKQVGAVISAAQLWEPCDHSRASSYGERENGQRLCGYCGRLYVPKEAS